MHSFRGRNCITRTDTIFFFTLRISIRLGTNSEIFASFPSTNKLHFPARFGRLIMMKKHETLTEKKNITIIVDFPLIS